MTGDRARPALAKERAKRSAASRAKDEFLAALSHELRTPLNPVLLVASDSANNPDFPASARMAFRTIEKNALLEARLIDDLLDLTRIEHGKLKLELQTIDAHVVAHDAPLPMSRLTPRRRALRCMWTSPPAAA